MKKYLPFIVPINRFVVANSSLYKLAGAVGQLQAEMIGRLLVWLQEKIAIFVPK